MDFELFEFFNSSTKLWKRINFAWYTLLNSPIAGEIRCELEMEEKLSTERSDIADMWWRWLLKMDGVLMDPVKPSNLPNLPLVRNHPVPAPKLILSVQCQLYTTIIWQYSTLFLVVEVSGVSPLESLCYDRLQPKISFRTWRISTASVMTHQVQYHALLIPRSAKKEIRKPHNSEQRVSASEFNRNITRRISCNVMPEILRKYSCHYK